MSDLWEFYEDEAGEHRWRMKDAHNGNVLFVSAEGYADVRDAQQCARRAGWNEETGLGWRTRALVAEDSEAHRYLALKARAAAAIKIADALCREGVEVSVSTPKGTPHVLLGMLLSGYMATLPKEDTDDA